MALYPSSSSSFLIITMLSQDKSITGFFGNATRGYVARFQAEQGFLPALQTGIVGPLTRGKIAAVCTGPETTSQLPGITPTSNQSPSNNPTPLLCPYISPPQCSGTLTQQIVNGCAFYSCTPTPISPASICSIHTPETRQLSCPTGQTGSITETRTSSCPSSTGLPVWSAWATTASTCNAAGALCNGSTCYPISSLDPIDASYSGSAWKVRAQSNDAQIGLWGTLLQSETKAPLSAITRAIAQAAVSTGQWRLLESISGEYSTTAKSGDCNDTVVDYRDSFLNLSYSLYYDNVCNTPIDLSRADRVPLNIISYLEANNIAPVAHESSAAWTNCQHTATPGTLPSLLAALPKKPLNNPQIVAHWCY